MVYVACGIGYIGGATNWPMWFGYHLAPYPNIAISLYVALIAYSILRYRLMDVNLLVRWGIAYGALLVNVAVLFLGFVFLIENLFSHLGMEIKGFPSIIACCIMVFIFDPLRKKISKLVDQFIFKSPDFKSILTGIEDQLKNVGTIQLITSGLVVHFKKIWNVEHAGFAIWNSSTSNFELLPLEAFKSQIVGNITDQIDRNDFLIKTLETERRLFPYGIVIDDEVITLSHRAMAGERATFAKIRRTLRWLGAAVSVPLMLNTELIGFMVLGPKKNNVIYNDEDKKFLSHVSEMVSETVKKIILNQPVELTKLNTAKDG